jgi:hypothetical protein
MTCADAANVLCGIVAKGCEKAYVVAFGTDPAPVLFTRNDTVISVADKVASADTHGHNTNGHRCVQWLVEQGITPDRVIFLSDMQMWNSSSCNSDGYCVADVWDQYARQSKEAAKTWLHCVHLNGYGDSVVDEGDRVNQIGGFSEKVFGMLAQTEGLAEGEDEEETPIPTIEQIRQGWTVKAANGNGKQENEG